MQETLTRKITSEESDRYLHLLEEKGFRITFDPAQYIVWRAQGHGFTISYYTSGSFVAQGVGDMSFLSDTPGGTSTFKSHAGADEVGKGDYFGPLVVCGVYLTDDSIKSTGITDSKKLADLKILKIYEEIKEKIVHQVEIITPKMYNEQLKAHQNVAYFLASVHAKVANDLVTKNSLPRLDYVVDQFSANKSRLTVPFKNVNVNLIQFHKGESDLAVACASVIARAVFLKEMDSMSEKYEMTFPKGATDVINFGKEFVKKYGREELNNVAKVSFRTTTQI